MNEIEIIHNEKSYDSSDDLFLEGKNLESLSFNNDFPIAIKNINNFDNVYLFLNENNNNNIYQDNNHIFTFNHESNQKIDLSFSQKHINYQTFSNIYQNNINFPNNNEINEINDEKDFSYKFFSLDDINEILSKKKSLEINKINFKKNKLIENLECKLCKIKRKREKGEKKFNDDSNQEKKKGNIEVTIKSKRGRKTIGNISREEHNKMSSDNIIKKIKGKIFQYLVTFMNNLLERKEEDKNKIYKIYYKYIDKVNKKIDLEILEKSLKDILSMEITPKVKAVDKYFNKRFIEKIKNKEEPVNNYDTIMFVLNIKLRDWISLFTFKKNIDDIIKEKDEEEYNQTINKKIIEESLIGVDDLINKMYQDNNEQYLLSLIFHLYNYERWFFIRAGRNLKLN